LKTTMLTRFAAIAISALAMVACNSILGIEKAAVDPNFSEDAGVQTGSGTDPLVFDCPSYCTAITKNCKGDNLEYANTESCAEMCSHFDTGRPGDQAGDSLACRVFHANAAARDPDVHCRHAGPVGGNHCGDPCSAFCLQVFAICGDRLPYASEAECRQICPSYPYVTGLDGGGDLAFEDGPTLNCRVYHLQSAIANPATHCSHTSLSNVHCTPPLDAGADAPAN